MAQYDKLRDNSATSILKIFHSLFYSTIYESYTDNFLAINLTLFSRS